MRWAVSSFVVVWCFAAVAWASPSGSDTESAKAHYKKGLSAYALGKFQEAATEYEAAFAVEPDPALIYNAAQAHRLAGNRERAVLLYENYLRLFPNRPNEREVRRHIAQLKAAIERAAASAKVPAPADSSPSQKDNTEMAIAPRPTEPRVSNTVKSDTAGSGSATSASASSGSGSSGSASRESASRQLVAPQHVVEVEKTHAEPTKKRPRRWVWGVVGGVAGAAAIAIAVGLTVGLSGTDYPHASIGTVVLR